MFRRKEESLFGNEFHDEGESFTVLQPSAEAQQPALQTVAPVITTPTVAASTASVQPITRPAAVPPVAVNFRPATTTTVGMSSLPAAAIPSSSRSMEHKTMNPISSAIPAAAQSNAKTGTRVLTVGHDILLKGEITTCDRLVIEGKVEATISDVNTVELAECGSFKGSAHVVDAYISGTFDGDLVVTGRLVIHASGTVSGNISYGEIEIERGGQMTGQIKAAGVSSAPKALRKEAA